jgi:hypothetical protein
MPIGPGRDGFTWDYDSIVANAPAQFGVYAIYNQRACVAFLESGCRIQRIEICDNCCGTGIGWCRCARES